MGSLFAPKVPKPTPPAPIVDENDPAVMEAGRKRRREMASGGGRSSTILSGGGGANMAAEYSGQKLG
jgi:hypothetical protein